MTAAEQQARRIRDNWREEKQRLSVLITDCLLRTDHYPSKELCRAYREADRRLIAAHRRVIAIMGERIATKEKTPVPATGPALSLNGIHWNPTTSDQSSGGERLHI